ncbi:MAG: hypothetical protein H6Q74_2739 [Firmicutes bacterium]|nr:hypothetical protein [Bacillota bacterium]
MLRKLSLLIFVLLLLVIWSGICFSEPIADGTEPQWDISARQYHFGGNADFWLYYPSPSTNVISQLHAPQKQTMNVFEIKYNFCRNQYLRLNYGTTGEGNKGQGFDKDWNWTYSHDYNQLTDYGTMNFHGAQKNYNLDYGYKIGSSAESSTYAFVGWTQHKSTNELRDIVYYRENNIDITPTAQAVYGAYYNLDFKGCRLGLEHTVRVDQKLTINGLAALHFIDANLEGLWTNHTPAWSFKDNGSAKGFELNVGAKYQFDSAISANFGYSYYYAKAKNCTRSMDEGSGYYVLSQKTDLELAQHGYYLGLSAIF